MRHLSSFLLLLLLGCWCSQEGQAQAYVRASFGPGLGVNRDAFGLPALRRDSSETVIEQRTLLGSFGSGMRVSVAGGYWFNPYFGAELGVYYFGGFQQAYGSSVSALGNTYERSGYSYQLRLAPALVIQAAEGKVRPFGRFGVVLPVAGQLVLEEAWYRAAAGVRREKTTVINGQLSLGFESSIGVEYQVSPRVALSLQLTYSGLRIRSQTAAVTKDIERDDNGNINDLLEGASTIFTQIEFQEVLTPESNISAVLASFTDDIPDDVLIQIDGDVDFNRPLNLPTQTINANSLMIEIGFQYTFGARPE